MKHSDCKYDNDNFPTKFNIFFISHVCVIVIEIYTYKYNNIMSDFPTTTETHIICVILFIALLLQNYINYNSPHNIRHHQPPPRHTKNMYNM